MLKPTLVSVFRCLAVPDDEREEADLDLPSVRQSCQIRRPHGRRILPGLNRRKCHKWVSEVPTCANVVFDDGGNAGAAGGDQGRGVA